MALDGAPNDQDTPLGIRSLAFRWREKAAQMAEVVIGANVEGDRRNETPAHGPRRGSQALATVCPSVGAGGRRQRRSWVEQTSLGIDENGHAVDDRIGAPAVLRHEVALWRDRKPRLGGWAAQDGQQSG